MRACVPFVFVIAACSRPQPFEAVDAARASPIVDASIVDASTVDATDVIDAAEAAAAAPRTCADLQPAEKKALESCASSRIHGLGVHGAFTVRVAMRPGELPRTRAENDIDHAFREAIRGDACDRAATLLASRLPCTWDVRGPFPAWTIRLVPDE